MNAIEREERGRTQFPPGFTVYRVQDQWTQRRGVVVRGARRPWLRTWQAEWDGCTRAVRAYTRNGVIVKAVAEYEWKNTLRRQFRMWRGFYLINRDVAEWRLSRRAAAADAFRCLRRVVREDAR